MKFLENIGLAVLIFLFLPIILFIYYRCDDSNPEEPTLNLRSDYANMRNLFKGEREKFGWFNCR